MRIDLEKLGVTRESLTRAVLSELGLSPEEAVVALAKELGVEVMNADDYRPNHPIENGEEVLTSQGAGRAAILTESELATLRDATAIQTRLFC